MSNDKLRHICEVCGVEENLTPEDAFEAGWDYPPRMGVFGIVSARTCPNCPINKTVWWAIITDEHAVLDERQIEIVKRIQAEPESIRVSDE